MIILLTGATHTGKTALAQKLLEKYKIPYLSIDHLKMGLIRSGCTNLTPEDDDALTEYLWPIVREIIKTAVENNQSMIVEGCYVPLDWSIGFGAEYLRHIRCFCLVMTEKYIGNNFDKIKRYANAAERRLDDSHINPKFLIEENKKYMDFRRAGGEIILIDESYDIKISP